MKSRRDFLRFIGLSPLAGFLPKALRGQDIEWEPDLYIPDGFAEMDFIYLANMPIGARVWWETVEPRLRQMVPQQKYTLVSKALRADMVTVEFRGDSGWVVRFSRKNGDM